MIFIAYSFNGDSRNEHATLVIDRDTYQRRLLYTICHSSEGWNPEQSII